MKENMDKTAGQVKEYFAKMEKKSKIRLGIGAGVLVIFAIVITILLSRTTYGVLYTGLSTAKSGEIYNELITRGEKVKIDGTGTIMVPEDRIDIINAQLTADGIVDDTMPNLSILDGASGFTATSADKANAKTYQDQYDMRQEINTFSKVANCVVNLSPRENSTYALYADGEEASASVIIVLAGPDPLTDLEAHTIRSYVSSAGKIPLENIEIMDDSMRLYPLYTGEEDEDDAIPSNQEQLDLKRAWDEYFDETVRQLLYPVFGTNVSPSASVTLNFDKITQEAIEFFPVLDDGGIPASIERNYEAWRGEDFAEGIPGTDSNEIGTVQYPWEDDNYENYYSRFTERTNYEITEMTTQTQKNRGHITDVSISVLVDSEFIEQEGIEELEALIANGVGIKDPSFVTVVAMPFNNVAETVAEQIAAEEAIIRSMQRQDLIKTIIIWVVIAAIVLMILLFLRYFFKSREEEELAQVIMADGTGLNVDYVAGIEDFPELTEDFDLSQKSEGIVQLERFIEKDPEAVASLLRNWLSDDV